MKKKPTSQFETTLAELEQIVERMERGELSLEEALAQFERGIVLARSCQQALREAEQRVQLLTRGEQGETLTPFDPDTNA